MPPLKSHTPLDPHPKTHYAWEPTQIHVCLWVKTQKCIFFCAFYKEEVCAQRVQCFRACRVDSLQEVNFSPLIRIKTKKREKLRRRTRYTSNGAKMKKMNENCVSDMLKEMSCLQCL
jgi:hypothetical protein